MFAEIQAAKSHFYREIHIIYSLSMLRLVSTRFNGTIRFFREHCTKTNGSVRGKNIPATGSGGFDLTFLGTSSQGGARRYPSSLALRIRGTASSQVWLFDAGEGATAQLQRSNMRVGHVQKIFITHLHGDHLFGLPGLIMVTLGRRNEYGPASNMLNNPDLESSPVSTSFPSYPTSLSARDLDLTPLQPAKSSSETLHVYGPQGIRSFLRTTLGVASFRLPFQNALCIHELIWPFDCGSNTQRTKHRRARPYWQRTVRPLQFEGPGRDIEAERSGEGQWTYRVISEPVMADDGLSVKAGSFPGSVIAAPVLHTVPTYAYTITENVAARRFDKDKLDQLGIPRDGRHEVRVLFSKWLSSGRGIWQGQEIDIKDVMQDGRRPRQLCVVGDTYDASPAAHIAEGVDVLIHEATNLTAQADLAHSRGHSSPVVAANFAKRVGAKRVILNHTSVGYNDRKLNALENEARLAHGSKNVFVARDLSMFSVPTEKEDQDDFVFRRFSGYASSIEFKSNLMNPFKGDFSVHKDGHSNGGVEDKEWSDKAGQQFDNINDDDKKESNEDSQMEETELVNQGRPEIEEIDDLNQSHGDDDKEIKEVIAR